MKTKRSVSVSIHEIALEEIDTAAFLAGENRSEYFRLRGINSARKEIQDAKRHDQDGLMKAKVYAAEKRLQDQGKEKRRNEK